MAPDGGQAEVGKSAEASDAAGVYRIWPGVPAGSESWTWSERTTQVPWTTASRRYARNVVTPTLTMFRPPEGKANGTSLVIAPGGAFHFLMVDHEGYDMARWLTGLGVTCFVLKYRVAKTPEADDEVMAFRAGLHKILGAPDRDTTSPPDRPALREVRMMSEEDGRQALRFVRQRAGEWGLDPSRIGIAGFSAGGGVAMGAAMQYDAASRPDYVVGVYPAWRGELTVPADAPPLFLVISDDDQSVAPMSSSRLYEAWHTAGSTAELHVFGNGGHGWGMDKAGHLSDIWPVLLENWMRVRGLV